MIVRITRIPSSSHSSQLVAYGVSRAVPALVSFASIPIYTSLLTPDQFGRYSVAVAAVAIADALCFQWLVVSVVRFLPMYRENAGRFITQIVRYYVVVLISVLFAGLLTFVLLTGAVARLAGLAVLLLAVTAWNEVNLELARSRFRVLDYALAASSAAIIGLVTGIAFAKNGFGAEAPLLGSTLALLATGIWFLMRDRASVEWFAAEDKDLLLSLIAYGGPMAAALLISSLLNTSDRFLIGRLLGSSSVGVYSAAWGLVFPTITIIGSTINLAGFPQIVHGFERADGTLDFRIGQQLRLLLRLITPAIVGAWILAPELAGAFLGPNYARPAASIMPGLALAAGLSALRALYTDIAFHLTKRSGTLSVIMLTALIFSVVSNVILLPRFGIKAAVWSALLGYSVALTLSVAIGRGVFILPRPSGKDIFRLVVTCLVMVVFLMATRATHGRWYVVARVIGGASVYFVSDWIFTRRSGTRFTTDAKSRS